MKRDLFNLKPELTYIDIYKKNSSVRDVGETPGNCRRCR